MANRQQGMDAQPIGFSYIQKKKEILIPYLGASEHLRGHNYVKQATAVFCPSPRSIRWIYMVNSNNLTFYVWYTTHVNK